MNFVFSYIKKAFTLLLATVMLFPSVISQGQEHMQQDIEEQKQRIAQLEQDYKNGNFPKFNEENFIDGDINSAKFNELSFVATHNSYQTESTEAFREIFSNLSDLTFGLVSNKTGGLNSQTLTEQFNCGIRSIELDIETVIENGKTSFRCMHSPVIDMTTSCYDFELALKEITMWSDNHPNHLPITIIIEPKKVFVPMEGMRLFSLKNANALDSLLRSALGDKLFTPSDMLRNYDSFAQMRANDDWCKVSEMRGKVLVLLHDTTVTDKYIAQDESIKSQAMFPMLRYKDKDDSYASFLLINKPAEALEHSKDIIKDGKFIVRTQVDSYTSVSREKREQAFESGAQILSTDYPVRTDLKDGDYYVSFDADKTVKVHA